MNVNFHWAKLKDEDGNSGNGWPLTYMNLMENIELLLF